MQINHATMEAVAESTGERKFNYIFRLSRGRANKWLFNESAPLWSPARCYLRRWDWKTWKSQLKSLSALLIFLFHCHSQLRRCLRPICALWLFCFVFLHRLLIKNGNNIDSPPVYDSYEVEYLPNEGVVSTGRHLFIEFTTDETGTCTGAAIRYEGTNCSLLSNLHSYDHSLSRTSDIYSFAICFSQSKHGVQQWQFWDFTS